jgi:hypothetical protein
VIDYGVYMVESNHNLSHQKRSVSCVFNHGGTRMNTDCHKKTQLGEAATKGAGSATRSNMAGFGLLDMTNASFTITLLRLTEPRSVKYFAGRNDSDVLNGFQDGFDGFPEWQPSSGPPFGGTLRLAGRDVTRPCAAG